jgi:hypothetical protein
VILAEKKDIKLLLLAKVLNDVKPNKAGFSSTETKQISVMQNRQQGEAHTPRPVVAHPGQG